MTDPKVSIVPFKRSPITQMGMHLADHSVWWYSCGTCGGESPRSIDKPEEFVAMEKWRDEHACPPLDDIGIGLSAD